MTNNCGTSMIISGCNFCVMFVHIQIFLNMFISRLKCLCERFVRTLLLSCCLNVNIYCRLLCTSTYADLVFLHALCLLQCYSYLWHGIFQSIITPLLSTIIQSLFSNHHVHIMSILCVQLLTTNRIYNTHHHNLIFI